MRVFLGFAVLFVGVSGIFAASAQPLLNDQPTQTVIRTLKGDRLAVPRPEEAADHAPRIEGAQIAFTTDSEAAATAASEEEVVQADVADTAEPGTEAGVVHRIPLDEFCDVLISSARANDLPIVFFTNLIWQESRFNPNSISRAGAQGVAQFMPETAAANGLENPFNPFQAVPASARLLRQLQEQFGNVGLAAAAYNAGPGRVTKWLSKRGSLPRETRAYVVTITGRPAEQWRGTSPQMTFRPAPDLPCSQTPAFTELNAAESEENAAVSARAEIPLPRSAPVRLFAARARASAKIKSKPVQLTLVAPEPGQAATSRPKKNAASHDKGRKLRRVRLASTSP
jgi:hypothetical protein